MTAAAEACYVEDKGLAPAEDAAAIIDLAGGRADLHACPAERLRRAAPEKNLFIEVTTLGWR